MRRLILSVLMATVTISAFAVVSGNRGNQQLSASYRQNQRNNFFMVTQPDVDSECRSRIYNCLAEYCGDVLVVPGNHARSQCHMASENDLYNWTLMCLQRDRNPLLPQFSANNAVRINGMNTAARLCPPYIQSELMSYLSMANMADQLALRRSDECVSRRHELNAALACHQVALAFGDDVQNRLESELTRACGPSVAGGSTEMVRRFAMAGNLGANILGWAERMISMNLSSKGPDWQIEMDQVLAFYANRMNLACGDNMQMNVPQRQTMAESGTNPFPAVTMVLNRVVEDIRHNAGREPGAVLWDDAAAGSGSVVSTAGVNSVGGNIWAEMRSLSDIFDQATARQVINAGLTNSPLTQNAFLTSNQMAVMQEQFRQGVKVFILRDSARCFMVPVQQLTAQEQTTLAHLFSSCVSR